MTNRHTGIDLHTNSFTCGILQEGREEVMPTWFLRKRDVSHFIATLWADDEVAVEATGNSARFRGRVEPNVARVIVGGSIAVRGDPAPGGEDGQK